MLRHTEEGKEFDFLDLFQKLHEENEMDFDSLHTIEFVKLLRRTGYRPLTLKELDENLPERPYWAQSFYYMKDRLIS